MNHNIGRTRQALATQTHVHTWSFLEVAARGSPLHTPITCLPRSSSLFSSPTAPPPLPPPRHPLSAPRALATAASAPAHTARGCRTTSVRRSGGVKSEGGDSKGESYRKCFLDCPCTRCFSRTNRIQNLKNSRRDSICVEAKYRISKHCKHQTKINMTNLKIKYMLG